MKFNVFHPLIFVLFSLLFISCEKEQSPVLSSQSENGEMKVTVQGSRYISTDPFKVSVSAILESDTVASVELEAMTEAINDENVSFEWEGNNKCYVHITQKDGSVRTVPVTIMK